MGDSCEQQLLFVIGRVQSGEKQHGSVNLITYVSRGLLLTAQNSSHQYCICTIIVVIQLYALFYTCHNIFVVCPILLTYTYPNADCCLHS